MNDEPKFVMGRADGFALNADGSAERWSEVDGVRTEERWEPPQSEAGWALGVLQSFTCGCNDSEATFGLVRAILRLMPLYDGRWDECRALIGSEGAFYIVLEALTEHDLIEHGGNVGGSWITETGERLLATLEPIADFDAWEHETDNSGWTPAFGIEKEQ